MKQNADIDIYVVRCNYCEHVYPENEIRVKENDTEYCENCNTDGHLMDLGKIGEINDSVVFPILSKCRDWKQLKMHFDTSTLCFFENEIHDYEYNQGAYSEANFEDCAYIIYWFEGSVDTKDLIEHYNTL